MTTSSTVKVNEAMVMTKRARSDAMTMADPTALPSALWLHIIDFACGQPPEVDPLAWLGNDWNDEFSPYSSVHIKQRHRTAQTLCALRSTCKALNEHFGPSNQSLWQDLVLHHFSFDRTHDTFKACYTDYATEYLESGHLDVHFTDLEKAAGAIRLHGWPRIGVAFRPWQYGFLEEIQSGQQPRSAWPVDEDAYKLYKDLFFLITCVGPISTSTAYGEGSGRASPVLFSGEGGADVGYCVGLSEDPSFETQLVYKDKISFADDDGLIDEIQNDQLASDEEDSEEDEGNEHGKEDSDEEGDGDEVDNGKDEAIGKSKKTAKKRRFRLRLIERIDATLHLKTITNNDGCSGTTPYFDIGQRHKDAADQHVDMRRWLGVAVAITWT